MRRRILILTFVIIIFATSFYYFNNSNKTVDTDKTMIDEDTQLISKVIEIETNMTLTHTMKMSFDELISKLDPYILSYYKEAYFEQLKRSNETRNLVPYLYELPKYRYVSKVYSNDNNSIKQVFIKFPVDYAVVAATRTPVKGTKSQIAKIYVFKKENAQWKISAVNDYYLSLDRNKPKQIIERFTNYNNMPIEYEYIKIIE